jgi:hypothetical protein
MFPKPEADYYAAEQGIPHTRQRRMSVGPVLAAAIGAGGAVIGGGMAAGSNIWLESARAKRAAVIERHQHQRELRRAARLVVEELAHSAATILQAEEDRQWGEAERKELKYQRWKEHQQVLADLPDDAWSAVSGAYELLYLLYRHTAGPNEDLPSGAFDETMPYLNRARDALRPFARGHHGTLPPGN